GALPSGARVTVTLEQGSDVLARKTLHAGDPDFYAPFHVNAASRPVLRVDATEGLSAHYSFRVNRWPQSPSVDRGSNHRWQDASPMVLGETVFGSGDTVDYVPVPGT